MQSDAQRLSDLLVEIESSIGWGPAREWTNSDFQELSDRITEATGTSLSASTLKRVWGRVAYASQPSTTTLDALAVFAGYAHYRAFRAEEVAVDSSPVEMVELPALDVKEDLPSEIESTPMPRPRRKRYIALGVGCIAVIVLLFTQSFAPASPPEAPTLASLNADDFHLAFRPVASGVPNSVVFDYSAEAASNAEVYLQQSWDPTRREQLDPARHTHTSIYYLPGYYRAKLVVADQVVQERELYLRSDDWVAAVDIEPVPVYLPIEDVHQDGQLAITEQQLTNLGLVLQPSPPTSVLTHVGALEDLWSDDFTFSTRLRHDYAVGAAACQFARVLLLLKNSAIIIPLSAPGCIADLELYAGGQRISGRDVDLSAFGVVGSSWLEISCRGENGLLTFSIDGKQVYQLESEEQPKEIIGIRYEFSGMGSVDELHFGSSAGERWEELF